MVFPFSHKKAKIDELQLVRQMVNDQQKNYVNFLRSLEQALEIIAQQNDRILKLLEEKKQNG